MSEPRSEHERDPLRRGDPLQQAGVIPGRRHTEAVVAQYIHELANVAGLDGHDGLDA